MYLTYLHTPELASPTLDTLYEMLRAQPEPQAHELATALELYARGSASGFAQQTNVDTTNRVMVFDLAALGADLQTFGMMVVLEEVWRRIVANKRRGVRTWLYVDEFHVLFANDYAGAYCQSLFKRVRKYGAAATGITQNIEELLESERARL
ncbi:transfer complex protein, partial [Arcanobacterium bovis]